MMPATSLRIARTSPVPVDVGEQEGLHLALPGSQDVREVHQATAGIAHIRCRFRIRLPDPAQGFGDHVLDHAGDGAAHDFVDPAMVFQAGVPLIDLRQDIGQERGRFGYPRLRSAARAGHRPDHGHHRRYRRRLRPPGLPRSARSAAQGPAFAHIREWQRAARCRRTCRAASPLAKPGDRCA